MTDADVDPAWEFAHVLRPGFLDEAEVAALDPQHVGFIQARQLDEYRWSVGAWMRPELPARPFLFWFEEFIGQRVYALIKQGGAAARWQARSDGGWHIYMAVRLDSELGIDVSAPDHVPADWS